MKRVLMLLHIVITSIGHSRLTFELSGVTRSGRGWQAGFFIQSLGRHLPIFPVERTYFNRGQIDAIDAADVKDPSAGVEAWAGERVNSAVATKIVLRGFRVELIKHEIGFAREETKTRIRSSVPESPLAATQGAVAVDDVAEIRPNLEHDSAAMA